MKVKKINLNQKRNVNITAFIQDVGGEFDKLQKRPAVLILPGGGYTMCSDREAEPVAFAYAKAGYQTFILRYSVGENSTWPNPLNDYEQAMEMIRDKAEKWHVYEDKIAVLGFSAGGHLAACAATMSKNRPNAGILGYAALSKETGDMCQPGMPEPIQEVDELTAPCFLFSARDDSIVPVSDTVKFEMALINKSISFESHIYAYGSHGFSTGEDSIVSRKICSRVPRWVQDSIEWLGDMFGKFGDGKMTEPSCPAKVNGNSEEYLSIDCTISHLKKQGSEAMNVLSKVFTQLDKKLESESDEKKVTDVLGFVDKMKLRDILEMWDIPEEEILKMNDELNNIKNITAPGIVNKP